MLGAEEFAPYTLWEKASTCIIVALVMLFLVLAEVHDRGNRPQPKQKTVICVPVGGSLVCAERDS